MNILLLAEFNRTGGTRTFLFNISELLSSEGYKLCGLFSAPIDCLSSGKSDLLSHFDKYKFLQHIPKIFRRNILRQFWEFFVVLRYVILWKPDLLIVSHGTPGNWLSLFLFNLPCLQILHTEVQDLSRVKQLYYKLFLQLTGVRKKLITVSCYAAKKIRNSLDYDCQYIYNSVRDKNFIVKKSSIINIVTIGHVIDYKNPYTWLNVAQRLTAIYDNVRFVWYGGGPLLEVMRSLSHGLSRIEFAGPTAQVDMVLQNADIYFHPSLLESHGIAVLEAMQAGLPCVVSDVGGLPESVVNQYNGYVVPPMEANSFSMALFRLIESEELRVSMGEKSREIFQSRFSYATWKKNILETIKQLATF